MIILYIYIYIRVPGFRSFRSAPVLLLAQDLPVSGCNAPELPLRSPNGLKRDVWALDWQACAKYQTSAKLPKVINPSLGYSQSPTCWRVDHMDKPQRSCIHFSALSRSPALAHASMRLAKVVTLAGNCRCNMSSSHPSAAWMFPFTPQAWIREL